MRPAARVALARGRLPQLDAGRNPPARLLVACRDASHLGLCSRNLAMAFRRNIPIGLRSPAAVLCLLFCLPLQLAQAQSDACALRPNKYSPNEKILRCGADLAVQPAPGTVYRPLDAGERRPPAAVQLDSGALLIEFQPTKRRRDF